MNKIEQAIEQGCKPFGSDFWPASSKAVTVAWKSEGSVVTCHEYHESSPTSQVCQVSKCFKKINPRPKAVANRLHIFLSATGLQPLSDAQIVASGLHTGGLEAGRGCVTSWHHVPAIGGITRFQALEPLQSPSL